MTAGYAASSDARKRNAEKAAGYDAWRLARSCKPCQNDHARECNGIAWDVDEARVIECLCGLCGANDSDVTIPPPDPADAPTAHGDGLEAHLQEGKGCE